MALGALGQVSSYDGGVQAVSDLSLCISTHDPGFSASQEPAFRNTIDIQSTSNSSKCNSIRCA